MTTTPASPGCGGLAGEFAEATGLHVELSLPAPTLRLPEATDLAVYRAVQEGLTNVCKHSGAEEARVVVAERADGGITVHVSDDGTPARRSPPPSTGLGLLGVQERVTALGGRLLAGPGDHGFDLRVELPPAAVRRTQA